MIHSHHVSCIAVSDNEDTVLRVVQNPIAGTSRTFPHSYAPNPFRKHTRGRRGKVAPGFTHELVEFEETMRAADRHAQRILGEQKGKERQRHHDAKQRALRGLRAPMKRPSRQARKKEALRPSRPLLSHEELLQVDTLRARRDRVAAGIEGVSRAVRRFAQEEGLAPRPHRTARCNVEEVVVKKLSLAQMVGRFKRTGKLPPVPVKDVQELQKSEGHTVNGAVLRRMIEAMLLRSGVEQNPGPAVTLETCPNQGKSIRGEIVRCGKRQLVICNLCPAKLTDTHGSYGHHPIYTDDGADTSASQEKKPAPAVAAPPTAVPEAPKPAPKSQGQGPSPSRPSVEQKHPEPPIRLSGRRLTPEDRVAVMSAACGRDVDFEEVQYQWMELRYTGERRLITSRNVQEVKASMVVCQMRTDQMIGDENAQSKAAACVFLAVAAGLGAAFYWPISLLSVCALGSAFYFYRKKVVQQSFFVSYIPHLVSCLMTEYDRGTSAEVVKSTIGMRARRLGALPIPDEYHEKFVADSVFVASVLLEKSDFFGAGVACFALPQ